MAAQGDGGDAAVDRFYAEARAFFDFVRDYLPGKDGKRAKLVGTQRTLLDVIGATPAVTRRLPMTGFADAVRPHLEVIAARDTAGVSRLMNDVGFVRDIDLKTAWDNPGLPADTRERIYFHLFGLISAAADGGALEVPAGLDFATATATEAAAGAGPDLDIDGLMSVMPAGMPPAMQGMFRSVLSTPGLLDSFKSMNPDDLQSYATTLGDKAGIDVSSAMSTIAAGTSAAAATPDAGADTVMAAAHAARVEKALALLDKTEADAAADAAAKDKAE